MLIADRDLLQFEPQLFREVFLAGQTLVEETGTLSAGVLTAAQMTAAHVAGPGHVVVMGTRTMEVVQRVSATELRLSLVRVSDDAPQIVPPNEGDAKFRVTTFGPQIAAAHTQLLAMLGLDALEIGEPGAAVITNPGDLKRLEALLTLELIYIAIAPMRNDDDGWAARAQLHARRAGEERQRVRAYIDTDGDGEPDVVARLNGGVLGR
jgi:hypothetical protein